MSSNVDERVVKLSFDNKKFEKNVQQSITTLDKFNDRLKFDNVKHGAEQVKASFTAMQVVAFTAISRITNRIITLGIQLVKSLSVDNISAGWVKFGQKTTSVATLAAQNIKIAGKSIEDYGEKMQIVTEQLEKLNWFTDETSYNFTDMVDNIGKFTAAGRDLDESVKAMEGIATWAALSGQNAMTASRAMYQLAQALGKGNIQLIDWRSIQNANMDTQEFRQVVLDTAVSIGQLTKEGENYITKAGTKFNINQFTEQLSSKWFTSDVLVKSLDKYSKAVEQVYEIAKKEGITASEVMDKYGDQIDEFGLKAFRSAQEAKTLTDALNSVKDAVSTGWMNTAEKIFGGYDESRKLWTELANELYGVFAEGGNFRNQVLGLWKDLGGRASLFGEHGSSNQGAFWNIYDAIIAVRDLITETWNSIFSDNQFTNADDRAKSAAQSFKKLTDTIQAFTKRVKDTIENSTQLRMVLTGIFSSIKLGLYVLQAIRFAIDPIIQMAKDLVKILFNRIAGFAGNLSKLQGVIEGIENVATKVYTVLYNLMETINPSGVLDSFIDFLKEVIWAFQQLNIIEIIRNIFVSFFAGLEAGGGTLENLKRIVKGLTSLISILGKALAGIAGVLGRYLLPVIGDILNILSVISGFVSGILTNLLAIIGDFFSAVNDILTSGGTDIETLGSSVLGFVSGLPDKLKKLSPILSSLGRILRNLIDILFLIPKVLDEISKSLTGRSIIDNIDTIFESIANILEHFKKTIEGIRMDDLMRGSGIFFSLGRFVQTLMNVLRSVYLLITPLIDLISNVLNLISTALNNLSNGINNINNFIGPDPQNILRLVFILTAVATSLVLIFKVIKFLTSTVLSILRLTKSLSYALETLSDAVYNLSQGVKLKALSEVIDSVGKTLLLFAISFFIISRIPMNGIIQASVVLGVFVVAMAAISAVIIMMNKGTQVLQSKFTLFDKENKKFFDSYKERNPIDAMAAIFKSIGSSLLRLSIAVFILTKLDSSKMWNSLGALIVFLTALGAITAAMIFVGSSFSDGNKGMLAANKETKRLAKTIKGMGTTLLLVALALKYITKIDTASLWNSIGVISVLISLFAAMIVIIGRFSNMGSDKKLNVFTREGILMARETQALNKVIDSISYMMLSLAASLMLITTIKDYNKLWNAVGVISTLISVYVAAVIAIELLNKTRFLNYKELSKTLNSFNKSMLALAVSVGFISLLSFENIWKAMLPILSIIAAYTACIIAMELFSKRVTGIPFYDIADIFNAMSLSMLSIASAVGVISLIKDPDRVNQGIGAIVSILAAMTSMVALLNNIANKNITNSEQIVRIMKGFSLALISITVTIGILQSFKDMGKVFMSVGVVYALLVALIGTLYFVGEMSRIRIDSKGTQKLLLSFSFTLLSMVAVIGILNLFSDIGRAFVSLGIIYLLLAGISAAAVAINKLSSRKIDTRGTAIMIGSIAGALLAISLIMLIVNTMPIDKILTIFGGIAGVFLAIAALIYIMGKMPNKNKVKKKNDIFPILTLLAANLLAFGIAMLAVNTVPWEKIVTTTVSFAAAVLAFALSIQVAAKAKFNKADAAKMGSLYSAFAGSMLAFGVSMLFISNVPWQKILTGTAVMTTAMLAFVFNLKLLASINNDANKAKNAAIMLGLLAVNFISFGASMALMAAVPWQNILVACIAMSAVLFTLVGASALMSSGGFENMLGLSVGMISLGIALVIFTAGLQQLENISWEAMAKGMVLVIGSLVAFTLVAAILSASGLVVALVAVAAAVMLLGGGMLMAAMAISMLTGTMVPFAEEIVNNVGLITEALTAVGNIITQIFIDGFKSLLDNLSTILPSLTQAMIDLVTSILQVLNETGAEIIKTVVMLFTTLLTEIANNIQPIMDAIQKIFTAVLDFLGKNIEPIAKFLVNMIITIISVLADNAAKFIQQICRLLVNLINALFDNFGEVIAVLLKRLLEFIQIIIPKFVEFLLGTISVVANAFIALIAGALRIGLTLLGTLAKIVLSFLAGLLLLFVHVFIGLGDVLFEAFRTMIYNAFYTLGKVIITVAKDLPRLLGGAFKILLGSLVMLIFGMLKQIPIIGGAFNGVYEWGERLAQSGLDGFSSEIRSGQNVLNALDSARRNISGTVKDISGRIGEDAAEGAAEINKTLNESIAIMSKDQSQNMQGVGENMGEGFNSGVQSSYNSAYKSGEGLGDSATSGAKDSLGIHSPSRVMAGIGSFLVQGFVDGIDSNSIRAENSIMSMMNSAISGIQDSIDAEENEDIVIRPVMDLSEIESGSRDISSIMSNISGSSVRASLSGSMTSNIQKNINRKYTQDSENQNGQVVNNSGDTYNPVFNITSNNPEEVANEVNVRLQKMRAQAVLAKGGAR